LLATAGQERSSSRGARASVAQDCPVDRHAAAAADDDDDERLMLTRIERIVKMND
jgi:hypothetical protein